MNRVRSGFHDINREFVTADARVEYRFGGRRGTVNAILQTGEAEVIFDDGRGSLAGRMGSHLQIAALG